MASSEARSSLDALLDRVQVMRVKFDDGHEPLLFDIVQEGSLRRLSMALDIDLAAHAEKLRKVRGEQQTVSRATVDDAIEKVREQGPANTPPWDEWVWARFIAAAFRAAGLRIEGDE